MGRERLGGQYNEGENEISAGEEGKGGEGVGNGEGGRRVGKDR